MKEHDVPDWYIESCRKIKYMFPKAHAVAYLMAAIRLMWFKVYHPAIFYAVYFTVRGADIDYEAAVGGVRVAKQHLKDNEKIPKEERTAKDDDALVSLQLENEMLQRGCQFLPTWSRMARSVCLSPHCAAWVMPLPLRWKRPPSTASSTSRLRSCSRPAAWRTQYSISCALWVLWAACPRRARSTCSA